MEEYSLMNDINKILAWKLPCENDDKEILCDECPFDIIPKVDCGLAILKERTNMLKLEIETKC